MNVRKIFWAILSLTLLLAFTLSFVSCGGTMLTECTEHKDENGDGICDTEGCGKAVENTPDVSADVFNENGEVYLFKDGAPTFQFVIGSDAIATHREPINTLATTLSSLGNGEIKTVMQDSEAMTVEILVGTVTNRGDEYNVNKYDYGANGYAVKQVGTKILVIGGSDTALTKAIEHLKTNVFGIKKTNPNFTDLTLAKDKVIDSPQTNYKLKGVTIDGTPISEYTIHYSRNSNVAESLAKTFRDTLYTKAGVYLNIKSSDPTGKAIKFVSVPNSGEGNGYSVTVDDASNLVFECEFEYKFEALAKNTYETKITNKSGSVSLTKGVVDTENIRDLYYDKFYYDENGNRVGGAAGDGERNDFEAIKGIHDLANKFGHTVHAREDGTAIYYIGKTGGASVTVRTDTFWHGCRFIFDDTPATFEVHNDYNYSDSQRDMCTIPDCVDCATRGASIFDVSSEYEVVNVTDSFAQYTAKNPLRGGWQEADNTTKIPGWNLPYLALVYIKTSDVKIYIRQGVNADGGDSQSEILLIHPDGTIDPSTPISYDYTSISGAYAYNVDPEYVKPITIDGIGANGQRTKIDTLANNPLNNNRYNATARNIKVTRSNVTIMNFDHEVHEDQEFRGPYAGICHTSNCSNVTWKNIGLDIHNTKYEKKSGGTALQGTYEIGGGYANAVSFINTKAKNFFADGSEYSYKNEGGDNYTAGEVAYRGIMGTNYCRNFLFDGCKLQSFDAHKGLGNVTIRNSEFEHMNIQGSGIATVENCTMWADGSRAIFCLRRDYGPSWNGDLIIKNVSIYYSQDYKRGNPTNEIMLLETYDPDLKSDYDSVRLEDGTYTTDGKCKIYLPKNVTVEGVSVHKYTYTGYDKENDTLTGFEIEVSNDVNVFLYDPFIHGQGSVDLSKYTLDAQKTVIVSTATITVENCDATIVLPKTAQFSNTECTVDGVEVDLWS